MARRCGLLHPARGVHRQAPPRVVIRTVNHLCEELIRVSAYAECVVCATQCFSANNGRWPLSKQILPGAAPPRLIIFFTSQGGVMMVRRRCSPDGTALAAQVHSCTSAPGQLHRFSGIYYIVPSRLSLVCVDSMAVRIITVPLGEGYVIVFSNTGLAMQM
jgi:hypothetical protein